MSTRIVVLFYEVIILLSCISQYKQQKSKFLLVDVLISGMVNLAVAYMNLWTMWVIFPLFIIVVIQFMKKGFQNQIEAQMKSQTMISIVYAVQYYTVGGEKDCSIVENALISWACFALLVAAFVLTSRNGMSHGMTIALNVGLFGAETNYIIENKSCLFSGNEDFLIMVCYVSSAILLVTSMFIFYKKKNE